MHKRKRSLIAATLGAMLLCGASAQNSSRAVLQDLKNGNQRFVSGQATHCHINDETLAAHESKQSPGAIILSCSDSRVPPERIFDREMGQLFTIRVAGNVLNDDVIASMEYAVDSLGARLIVVMGHDSCGAVKMAVSKKTDEDAGSPNLNHLAREIRANLSGARTSDPLFRDVARKNVSAVAADLTKRSKIIHDAVQAGKLQIAQAMYSLRSGKVEFSD